MFYAQAEGAIASEWTRRMKECMINLTPRFDARRMVNEYTHHLYDPAHENWTRLAGGGFVEARERAKWNAQVRDIWPRVNFVDMGPAPSEPVMSGKAIPVRAVLQLGGSGTQRRPGGVRDWPHWSERRPGRNRSDRTSLRWEGCEYRRLLQRDCSDADWPAGLRIKG